MKDGEPWWVLKDVCKVLAIADAHTTTRKLDDDEKGRYPLPTLGGVQEMNIINEFGLYRIIFRSDKREAQKFTRWVTHEVLPVIRKTGVYSLNKDIRTLEAVVSTARLFVRIMEKENRTPSDITKVVADLFHVYGLWFPLGSTKLTLQSPRPAIVPSLSI